MLQQRAELSPFGAVVRTGGETRLLGEGFAGDASASRFPELLDGLRRDRADFRAAAICSHVRLPDSAAVRIQLEHQEGQAVHVVVPYHNEPLEYGEPRRGTPFRTVWT